MSAETISLDAKELYGDLHNLDQFMSMKDGYENFYQLPCEICNGFCYLIKFKPGLILAITKHHSTKPFLVNYQDQGNRFMMSFTLADVHNSGSSPIVHNERPQPHTSNLSDSYMTYSPECSGVIEYPQSTNCCCICILLEPWLMKQFWDDCDNCISEDLSFILESSSSNNYYQKSLTITPMINLRLHEILNCRYQGSSRRYFFESKVLELLVNGFEQLKCGTTQNREVFPFGANADDFVTRTRDILLSNMINPPSLSELSSKVGVNKTTLNQCFRKTYGVSVFEYLRICRLEKAKGLLMNGRLTVTEVALEVGYAHHSSFTKEFKKYFSENPIGYLQ